MKQLILSLLLIGICISLNGQNTSAGIGVNLTTYNSGSFKDDGQLYTANIRTQFSNKWAWQTEVGYFHSDTSVESVSEVITNNGFEENRTTFTFTSRNNAALIRTSVVYKLLSINSLNVEAIAGGGMFKDFNNDIYGLIHGEIFFSTQISKHLVAGIPVNYDFVTWARDSFYSVGFSLRYHI